MAVPLQWRSGQQPLQTWSGYFDGPEQRRRPHVRQTEDSKGFKLLGNFMGSRESETLINTCGAPYLHERDLPSFHFGIQGHRNASGIQELLSHAPRVIGQSIHAPRAARGHILCCILYPSCIPPMGLGYPRGSKVASKPKSWVWMMESSSF